ncbi:MAG: hypothetical protein RIR48_1492, partial [Bacteroidota bacterium]
MIYKILAITCITIFILASCKVDQKATENSSTQEIKETYGTGETSRIYTRINGKIEGKMTDFY